MGFVFHHKKSYQVCTRYVRGTLINSTRDTAASCLILDQGFLQVVETHPFLQAACRAQVGYINIRSFMALHEGYGSSGGCSPGRILWYTYTL